jgi:peptidyl-prolyl cis-trans isomerase C
MSKAWIPVLLLALALAGCGGEKGAGTEGGAELVTIGDRVITEADFEAELSRVPPFQRRDLETPQGKRRFLDRMVEMELLHQAALDAGLEGDEAVQDELEQARRQILIRQYYKQRIETAAQPTEDAIDEYYEGHRSEFAVAERVRARMILAADERAARRLAERVAGGEDFAALARDESRDGATAAEDGNLGWFTRDGYVRSIGVNEDFTAAVFALAPGAVSEPIDLGDKGWALVLVEEKEDARQKPLDEVRGDIARRLAPKVREDYYKQRIEELKETYGVQYVGDPFLADATPEQLFQLAQDAKDPLERIAYYRQVVERHPDADQADRAMFMVGFVYSEEMQDTAHAQEAYGEFLRRYPDSDLAKDARYMLDALEGLEPPFESTD